MMILDSLKKYGDFREICEFGGGDSCFYEAFREVYSDSKYIVFDASKNGVNAFNAKFEGRFPHKQKAFLRDLLNANLSQDFNLCFSVGLIEHFDKKHTKIMCQKHFDSIKSGGIVLITYPTPTLLYRVIRRILEYFNAWEFKDERALKFDEVNAVCAEFGELMERKLNFYIGLTQEILVYRKY